MRALIDGRAYDTETAEEILRYPKRVNLGSLFCGDGECWTCHEFILYRTAKGAFFEYGVEDESIAALTRRQARRLLQEAAPDTYRELFASAAGV